MSKTFFDTLTDCKNVRSQYLQLSCNLIEVSLPQKQTSGFSSEACFADVQIEDWRQLQLFAERAELRHIFSLIKAIFLHSDTADQTQFLHEPSDGLVVHSKASAVQHCRSQRV